MLKQNATSLVLDHTHSRAICDEIGERLRSILKPTASDIPARLLELIARLAEQERQHLPQLDMAPSIVPSSEELSFSTGAFAVAAE